MFHSKDFYVKKVLSDLENATNFLFQKLLETYGCFWTLNMRQIHPESVGIKQFQVQIASLAFKLWC